MITISSLACPPDQSATSPPSAGEFWFDGRYHPSKELSITHKSSALMNNDIPGIG